MQKLSLAIENIPRAVEGERIRVEDVLQLLHNRGLAFFIFLFALPAALPVPAIGINTVIALPLLLLTGQQALGYHAMWLPRRMREKSMSKARAEKFIAAALPWVRRIERFSKPRLQFLAGFAGRRLAGVLGFCMALAVAIPLPLTNTVPSFGIAVMAVGLILHDGLAVIAGAVIGLCWIALLGGLAYFMGSEGLAWLQSVL